MRAEMGKNRFQKGSYPNFEFNAPVNKHLLCECVRMYLCVCGCVCSEEVAKGEFLFPLWPKTVVSFSHLTVRFTNVIDSFCCFVTSVKLSSVYEKLALVTV